jgi:hypothetical protein
LALSGAALGFVAVLIREGKTLGITGPGRAGKRPAAARRADQLKTKVGGRWRGRRVIVITSHAVTGISRLPHLHVGPKFPLGAIAITTWDVLNGSFQAGQRCYEQQDTVSGNNELVKQTVSARAAIKRADEKSGARFSSKDPTPLSRLRRGRISLSAVHRALRFGSHALTSGG